MSKGNTRVLEPKGYRLSFLIYQFLKYGYADIKECTEEFLSSERTTVRDIRSAKEVMYDLYGGHVIWNRKTRRYELADRLQVINDLIK